MRPSWFEPFVQKVCVSLGAGVQNRTVRLVVESVCAHQELPPPREYLFNGSCGHVTCRGQNSLEGNGRDSEGIWVPILSHILGREIQRGKFLIGFYDPAAHWLSFALTLASTLLQKGYVVNVTTTNTPPSEIRRIMNRAVPKFSETEVANRFSISDIYTWQTGRKSEEADTADSLSLAKASIDFGTTWLKKSMPNYDFVVTDNFSSFMRYNEERVFTQWLDKIIPHIREMKGVRIWSFIKRVHSDSLYAVLESLADGIIELDYKETPDALENFLRVKSMKGINHPTDWRKLKVNPDGLMQLPA